MPVTWITLERLTDVYLQPQPPPVGWLVGLGSGDTGDTGAAGNGGAVASGVIVAVPKGGCAAGCVVGVPRGGSALGVAELPGPVPAQAASRLLMAMIRRTLAIFCPNDGCHVIPNGAKRSEESLLPIIESQPLIKIIRI